MNTVIIMHDVYDRSKDEVHKHNDLCAFLSDYFNHKRPDNLRIYHQNLAEACDVTPQTVQDIEYLKTLSGTFYIVPYPAIAWLPLIAIIVSALSAAYSIYMITTMPKQNPTIGSSNNELSNRSNQARIKSRIPDIYGQLRAYPDLIAQTYTTYQNGVEIEECLMCLGRGYYKIHDMRDGDTDVANIAGTSVSVYEPNTNIIGTPQYQVGAKFDYLPRYVRKSASINGQTIELPNTSKLETANFYFEAPNILRATTSQLNFSEYFSANDKVSLSGAQFGVLDCSLSGKLVARGDMSLFFMSDTKIDDVESFRKVQLSGTTVNNKYDISGQYNILSIWCSLVNGRYEYTINLNSPKATNYNWNYITQDTNTVNASILLQDSTGKMVLDGVYTIASVSQHTDQSDNVAEHFSTIALVNPNAINDQWDRLTNTQDRSALVRFDAVESKYVGWFDFVMPEAEQVIFNLFFPNGLFYQDSKGGVWAEQVTLNIEIQQLDDLGLPTGQIQMTQQKISKSDKSQFGKTIFINLNKKGSFRFRLSRTTSTQTGKSQDTCKIKDVYAAAKLDKARYEGVTVIRSKTIATDGALSVKERKLSCLVTRRLKQDGTGDLIATKDAGQALINLALDPHVGRRSVEEVDIEQIKTEIQRVNTYFGSSVASEFSYTFDDDKLSFEEQAGMIAVACFSETVRFGNKLRLRFEQPQDNSVLLFNHRNKVPGSEKRTRTFQRDKSYDGIELEYTSPDDDVRVTYKIPEDGRARNPQKISTSGIRNEAVAKTRAWREWNKIEYSNLSCEFDALDESELLQRNDRILVADNTSLNTQDGEIVEVQGLTLVLSQNVEFSDGQAYYCYLQLSDGTVDMVQCHPGEMTNEIILVRAPLKPLVVDADRYVKTLYSIVQANDTDKQAFMLTELSPNDQMTNKLTCVNYDARFYEKDHTFI